MDQSGKADVDIRRLIQALSCQSERSANIIQRLIKASMELSYRPDYQPEISPISDAVQIDHCGLHLEKRLKAIL